MKKMQVFFVMACVMVSFLILTSTTKAFDLEAPKFIDITPYEQWNGLQFAGNNVLIGSKGSRLYRIVVQDRGQDKDITWYSRDVGEYIFDMAVPRENPFFVAYQKGGNVGMRYTRSDLGWRGGFGDYNSLSFKIAIADDGDHLVVPTIFNELEVWNVDDPSAERKKKHKMKIVDNVVYDVAMGERGLILVADGQWTEVWFRNSGYQFRMDSGARVEHLDHEAGYAASSCAGFIDIWQTSDGSYLRTLWLPDSSDAAFVAFSTDSRYLAAAVDTNGPVDPYQLHVFDRGTGSRLEAFTMSERPSALAFSPDDNLIVVGSELGRLYFFNNLDVAGAPAVETEAPANPDQTILLANYPNPFNPETWIPYQLAEPAEVTVTIHTVDGKLIRTLELGHRRAGVYQNKERAAYWDGKNEQGEPVASGVYFYTLTAGDFTATQKMLIRK